MRSKRSVSTTQVPTVEENHSKSSQYERNFGSQKKSPTYNRSERSSRTPRSHKHRLHPNDLVGLDVVVDFTDGNTGVQGKILKAVVQDSEEDLERATFQVQVGDKIVEKTYADTHDNIAWPVKEIVDHEGPLVPEDANYIDYPFNVKVVWARCGASCFDPTWESLKNIGGSDPESCRKYAQRKKLMSTPGWRFLFGSDSIEHHDDGSSGDDSSASSHSLYEVANEDSNGENKEEFEEKEENEQEGDEGGNDIAAAVSQDTAIWPLEL